MKKLVLIIVLAIAASILVAQTPPPAEKPWFDMQKCAVCKNLMTDPALMQHFTKWEHFKTADGLINLSVVDKDYIDAYKKAQANMDAVIEKMKTTGEVPYLCGSCMAYGEIMQEGAKYEQFQSDNIFMSSLTCDKPEVVAKIHAWVDRTQVEMAKMMMQDKPKQEEEGQKAD